MPADQAGGEVQGDQVFFHRHPLHCRPLRQDWRHPAGSLRTGGEGGEHAAEAAGIIVTCFDLAGFRVQDSFLGEREIQDDVTRRELLLDFGMPMGPLRLLDEVGFDIAAHAARSLHEAYGERMTPSQLLEPCIEDGRLGRKSGFGFYDWSHGGKGKESFHMAGDLTRFREGEELDLLSDADIVDRCVLAMVNEAARCLEEGVVRNAAELDLATVFGMGFAPFRGGLASYANSVGAPELVRKLEAIAECEDIRERPGGRAKFEPARMLQNLARDGGRWSSVRSTETKTPKKSAG